MVSKLDFVTLTQTNWNDKLLSNVIPAKAGIQKNDEQTDMIYKVSLEKTEEGYAVWVPGLPGCWSQGDTEEDALENIKDAIIGYLETVEELTKSKESRYVEIASHA